MSDAHDGGTEDTMMILEVLSHVSCRITNVSESLTLSLPHLSPCLTPSETPRTSKPIEQRVGELYQRVFRFTSARNLFQALQSLLSSLGHANDDSSSGATLSTEQCRKLSEKINEILGDHGADRDLTLGGQPSQVHVTWKCNSLDCRRSNTVPE